MLVLRVKLDSYSKVSISGLTFQITLLVRQSSTTLLSTHPLIHHRSTRLRKNKVRKKIWVKLQATSTTPTVVQSVFFQSSTLRSSWFIVSKIVWMCMTATVVHFKLRSSHNRNPSLFCCMIWLTLFRDFPNSSSVLQCFFFPLCVSVLGR